MGKIKICFVDDQLAPQPEFLGWSYSKQKEKIDNFVQQNESQIIEEVKKVKGVPLKKVNFQIINQQGLLPFHNIGPSILNQLSGMLLKFKDFEVKFIRRLNEIEDINTIDLLVLDIVGILDDTHNHKNLPNIPFIIFSGCSDIDQEIKSLPQVIKFYTKSKDHFELLMSGIEKCAQNKQINAECFDVISPQALLHLFLPLDIDMQALGIIEESKRQDYLRRMYGDNIDCPQKLKELQEKVGQLCEIQNINKERLEKLAGINNSNVSQFFENLKSKVTDPHKFLKHSWGLTVLKPFTTGIVPLPNVLGVKRFVNKW
jgi:hypothetical protein